MPKSKWFLFLYSMVLILIIVHLLVRAPFILYAIQIVVSTIAPTIIIGGILYYIFRPLVHLLEKKMHRVVAILLVFTVFTGVVAGLVIWLGPKLAEQVMALAYNFPFAVQRVQLWADQALSSDWWRYIQQQEFLPELDPESIADNFSLAFADIGRGILQILRSFFGILTSLIIVPFILFFLLKDGERLPDNILKIVPQDSREDGRKILHDMDDNLSAFIQGQAIVSLCVGILSLIAYNLLGLEYAIILALVSMFTNLIPFLGPFIGAIPVLIVAFFQDPWLALWTAIAILIIQQIESNIISPNVMGKKLSTHPVTIIFLLYIGANFAGVVGMILVIPFYAVGKAIVQNFYRLIKLRYPKMR